MFGSLGLKSILLKTAFHCAQVPFKAGLTVFETIKNGVYRLMDNFPLTCVTHLCATYQLFTFYEESCLRHWSTLTYLLHALLFEYSAAISCCKPHQTPTLTTHALV